MFKDQQTYAWSYIIIQHLLFTKILLNKHNSSIVFKINLAKSRFNLKSALNMWESPFKSRFRNYMFSVTSPHPPCAWCYFETCSNMETETIFFFTQIVQLNICCAWFQQGFKWYSSKNLLYKMNGITGRAKNFNKSVMYNFNNQSKPNCFLQSLIFFYLFYKNFQRKNT